MQPEERHFYNDIDAAADWTPVTDDDRPRRKTPAMTLPAYCEKRGAWERGEVTDGEWEEYQRLIHEHPCSWLNWTMAMKVR